MAIIFRLICQAEEKYAELKERRDKESLLLLKKLDFFRENIKVNRTFGEVIKKANLRKNKVLLNSFFERRDFQELIDLDNCFCCDLTRTEWRMLYTLMKDKKEDNLYIFCFMIVDHKTYEKYFT